MADVRACRVCHFEEHRVECMTLLVSLRPILAHMSAVWWLPAMADLARRHPNMRGGSCWGGARLVKMCKTLVEALLVACCCS